MTPSMLKSQEKSPREIFAIVRGIRPGNLMDIERPGERMTVIKTRAPRDPARVNAEIYAQATLRASVSTSDYEDRGAGRAPGAGLSTVVFCGVGMLRTPE